MGRAHGVNSQDFGMFVGDLVSGLFGFVSELIFDCVVGSIGHLNVG